MSVKKLQEEYVEALIEIEKRRADWSQRFEWWANHLSQYASAGFSFERADDIENCELFGLVERPKSSGISSLKDARRDQPFMKKGAQLVYFQTVLGFIDVKMKEGYIDMFTTEPDFVFLESVSPRELTSHKIDEHLEKFFKHMIGQISFPNKSRIGLLQSRNFDLPKQ